MKTDKKRRGSVLVLICLVILVISLAVAGLVSVINYNRYLEAVLEVETDEVQSISRTVADSLTTGQWRVIAEAADGYWYDLIDDDELEAVAESDEFQLAYAVLQNVTDSFKLENNCVFTLDLALVEEITQENFVTDESCILTFIMDSYPEGSETEPNKLSDLVIWWDTWEEYVEYRDCFLESIETKESFTLHETLENGSVLLTAYYPVFDGGEFVAYVSASRSVNAIKSFVSSFFLDSLLIGLAIALALCALAILLFHIRIVRPLRIITKEADEFIANNAQVSEKLSTIRTHDEIESLAGSFLTMEKSLQEYLDRVQRVTAEKERIRTELSVATRIQEDMLPRVFPPYPSRREFTVFASMDPAKEVGGDFYDFFFIDSDHLALVVADVSGKGVPASLFMVIAKTLIKTRSLMGGTPAEILKDVNAQLCDGNEAEMFVTVWLAILDVNTGKGVAANAGHEHPVLCRKGGDYELVVNRHSPAVATLETIRFREHEFELYPGDRIFIYSDGLPEATNAHDEMYGNQRMLDILNKCKDMPLSELLPAVTKDVEMFVGEAPQFDDLTMLAFEYNGVER